MVAGLETGADDYLPRGASSRHLLARLHAITRRVAVAAAVQPEDASLKEIVIAELRIIPDSRTAILDHRPLHLTAGEFDILLSLARAKGRVKMRSHLLAEIRNREYKVFDRAIDAQVSSLRRKLGDDHKAPRFICTVRAVGYMLLNADSSR